jgi:hypothetical protein
MVFDYFISIYTRQVRPIVGNKSIEAIEKAVFKPAALPFPAQNMDDIGRLSQSELEGHLTQVSYWSPFTVRCRIKADHTIT